MGSKSEITVKYCKLEEVELPSIVYKYRSWSDNYHKRFLTEREVFLASPRTFEDELDCYNPPRFDLLTKKQIYEYYIWSSKKNNLDFTRQQHRKFAQNWSKVSAVNNPTIVKQFMNKYVQEYYERIGVLCLTENWNNDGMWDKYADKGRGICIGYDTRIMSKHLGGCGPVEYQRAVCL
ncbi:MAG: DUF2971 domain-containing protein, partial [Flavobacterium sp.]|nr:DUF2971 domain-containing protein [Flavobacterium sp.]